VPDLVFKQLVAVVDGRTTMLCLSAAGQVRRVSEPYETMNGPLDVPPFHLHCRSISVPWMSGMESDLLARARAEILSRPVKARTARQPPVPGGPKTLASDELPSLPPPPEVAAIPAGTELSYVAPELRSSFVLSHPERFVAEANGGGISHTYWVTDKAGRFGPERWVLKRGEYRTESANEIVASEMANRAGLIQSEVIRAGPMGDGNGWVLIRHAEETVPSRKYKVVGTGGSHAKIAALAPKLEEPTDAVRALVHDFVVDEADAKGGNMLLLSRNAGETVRLQPIDRSMSLMGWRGAVEPGATRVTAGDWSLAGRLKVNSLREYMKTRGAPKGLHDLVQNLAEDKTIARELIAAYDDTVAKLAAVDLDEVIAQAGMEGADYAVETRALMTRRIEILQTERSRFLAQMGLTPERIAAVADDPATARLRTIGQEYLYPSEGRAYDGGRVYARYWEGDFGKTTLKNGAMREQTAQLEVEIGRMVDRFPVLERLRRVEWGQPQSETAIATYKSGQQELTLTTSSWADMERMRDDAQRYSRTGWWVPVSESAPALRATLTHELGHFIDDMSRKAVASSGRASAEVFESNVGPVEFTGYAVEALDDVYLPQIETMWERIGAEMAKTSKQANKRALTAAQAFDEKNVARYGRRLLSQYSSTSRHEFVAEAFSEYMTSNSPRAVARIVGETFEELFGSRAVVQEAAQEAAAVSGHAAAADTLHDLTFAEGLGRSGKRAAAETNREAFAGQGPVQKEIADLVGQWTGAIGDIDTIRTEMAAGQWSDVLQAANSGTEAPTLFRGMYARDDAMEKLIVNAAAGDEIDMGRLASFTESDMHANSFAHGANSSLVIQLKNARGLDIGRISNTPGELEWLVAGKAKVTRVVSRVVEDAEEEGFPTTHVVVEAIWQAS
jgi:hypothetical protein